MSIGWSLAVAALVCLAGLAQARPYVPDDDAAVVERLPERGDPALARLKRMRAALASAPDNLDIAAAVARHALDAARARGDPRFVGQAQAALAPWWTRADAPAAALLLRATVKQSQHDFAGALADLDRLLSAQPTLAQARLTRATVLAVVGRYADARRDCAALAAHASPMVVAACDATPASLSGDAQRGYDALVATLERSRDAAAVRAWALTLAAEIAARRGDWTAAGRHFRAALALDAEDAYLKGAYADFLLDRDQPADVLPLLRSDARNDGLLLRMALAEQRLPAERASFVGHRNELAARFDAARRRGDRLHQREEARFRLTIDGDAVAALALARDNWAVQREPADLRILVESARATGNAQVLRMAADWIANHRIEDAMTTAALRSAR
jgi:predicted Zn-dependent protease